MLLAPKLIPTEGNMIHLLRSRATRQQLDEMLEAMINIRPRQNNLALEILDPSIRNRVEEIVQRLLGGI